MLVGWASCGEVSLCTSRLVVEDTPKVITVWKDIGLVGEVGSSRVDKVDTWKPCGDELQCEL